MTRLLLILLLCSPCLAEERYNNDKLADAIYLAEGGNKTRFFYGIKSINTHGDKVYARKICINTINNNYRRWVKAGSKGDFTDFLGAVYCPPKAHPLNKNWTRNVRYFMREK